MEKLKSSKRFLFLSSIVIVLGVTFATVFKDTLGIAGIVFIVSGGVLFFTGIRRRNQENNQNIH